MTVGTINQTSVALMNGLGLNQTTSGASALEALLSGQLGPITSEGLFLVMSDLMEQQNLKIAQKTKEFKEQTALQEKYAQFLNWMQTAQSHATGKRGRFLDDYEAEKMLTQMGYENPYRDELLSKLEKNFTTTETINGDSYTVITPQLLANFLNNEIFGKDNEHLHIKLDPPNKDGDGEYTAGTFRQDHFNTITEKIDAAQKENCKDTTLLTTELSQLVSHQERISNMFSNMLKKFHDTEMAIIRNI